MRGLVLYILVICIVSDVFVGQVRAKRDYSEDEEMAGPTIIKAFYGGKDVTAKVARLVGSGSSEIPAKNAVFGDPLVGHVKTLTVAYQYPGNPPQLESVMEWSTLKLTPPPPAILKAYYGKTDVTAKVASLVKAGKTRIAAKNSLFGDPYVGHLKTLTIMYVNKAGALAVKTAVEHKEISLNL